MIRQKGAFVPNFATVKSITFMPNKKYQNSAMDYAMWYLEHLLKMEDLMGKKLEMKIDEMLERKFQQYLEKTKDRG